MKIYLSIYIYIYLDISAVQIEYSIWQHRVALQLCVGHCLCSLSTLRCGVEKSLGTTNEMTFPAPYNLWVGSVRQNTLCSADDATKAETATVWRLSIYIYIYIYIYISLCALKRQQFFHSLSYKIGHNF